MAAGQIGKHEQHVAHLFGAVGVIRGGVEFGQFLVQLGAHAGHIVPFEPDPRRTGLKLFGAHQGGQGRRHPIQRRNRLFRCTGRGPFFGLDAFPFVLLGICIPGAGAITEDMRMATFHLLAQGGHHIGEREMPGFFGHAAVKDDLEQQIAQFLLQFRHVPHRDGFGHFIGFLDRVWRDRIEILGQIPRAAILLVAKGGHDGGEASERERFHAASLPQC